MDAGPLLIDVAETYRGLRSLRIEALSRTESGDASEGSENHHRVQFVYRAPDHFRSQRLGNTANPLPELQQRPHVFRWEMPFGNGEAFLFHSIAEHVA
jgi:hypothetical protein